MRRIRMLILVAVLALIAALAGNPPSAAPEKKNITFETIRYDDLGERIKDLQGRVVVVDFWAQYCLPCKREFPRLVDLHRKYAGQGLAAVSVSVDDVADPDACERARQFLTDQKALFANYLLNEKPPVWLAKLKVTGVPCAFVFNRRGELLKKFHDNVDYGAIEQIVVEALKQ
jgi:thiol-disulfide isomerase/thioredoxin